MPNVRISLAGRRPDPGTNTHATTVCLCTSSPQHRSYMMSMDITSAQPAERRCPLNHRFCCACFPPWREQQSVVPRDTQVNFIAG